MNKTLHICCLLLTVMLLGCEKKSEPNLDEIVTQSYLFAGEPVDDIYVTQMLKFGGSQDTAQPINDAIVSIEWQGKSYDLLPNGGDTGYYYCPDTTLQILVGETYSISIEYFDKVATSTTTVPPPPTNVQLSADTIHINADSVFKGKFPPVVTVSWDNPNMDYYYITASVTDPNPQPIYPFNLTAIIHQFIFTEPTNESSYDIQPYEFNYHGLHEVRVYSVNQEYVELFKTFDQDSRTLNEPQTNIENGLGIFTSFSSNAQSLWVLP